MSRKETKAICPKCESTKTEYNDEYCAYIEYYCEDCGYHFKDYQDGEIKYKNKEENKMVKFDGELENLTLPYYGFYEVKETQDDKTFISYSNGMLNINGLTKEITFEASWLACNKYPSITVEDIMVLTKMPLNTKEEA